MSTPPQFQVPIGEDIPQAIKTHLQLIYDRLINHGNAFTNVQNQLNTLQAQVKTLQENQS